MLAINKEKEKLKEMIGDFIWEFKIADNVLYNLDILHDLIEDFNNRNRNYGKPISIISISIVEAVMIDFLYRLYYGTNHFPLKLRCREDVIKNRLKNETQTKRISDIIDGEREISVIKNFNFSSMISIYEELELLGHDEKVYNVLFASAKFRNRVHIKNYFGNFEKNEHKTFLEERVQTTIDLMMWIFDYFEDNYKRPWNR